MLVDLEKTSVGILKNVLTEKSKSHRAACISLHEDLDDEVIFEKEIEIR